MRLTAADIVYAIEQLPRNQAYTYINSKNRSKIEIANVQMPEGPITIRRYNPSKGGTPSSGRVSTISAQMIWRIANAFSVDMPINFDRVLGASYNTRSALEALLAHTPQFYVAYPGRIESIRSSSQIKKGHKHLIWKPGKPHVPGKIEIDHSEIVISEMPGVEAVYEALVFPDGFKNQEIDIDIKRRHAQIQVALIIIGARLGFRTWIAHNDKGIVYKEKKIGEMQGVVRSLNDENMIANFADAANRAKLIDCIWFKNGRLMPAVIEIEHSTGVTSGLTRMQALKEAMPNYGTRFVIVAPDEDRARVTREINRPQFRDLNARYFPYSAVEELYSLCQRRKLKGVTEEFLDCYMEPLLNPVSALEEDTDYPKAADNWTDKKSKYN